MTSCEIRTYLAMMQKNDTKCNLYFLNKKRGELLEEMYQKQKQIDELDYLRSKIKNEK